MKHLTMKRDDFIANILLLGFGRSIYDDPGLQLILGPKRVLTILHSAKDVTIYIRYRQLPFSMPGRQPMIGKGKRFRHDNRAALDWLTNYITEYRREHDV